MKKYAVVFASWRGCEEIEQFDNVEEAKAYAEQLEEAEGMNGYSVEEGYEVVNIETGRFVY